MFPHNRDNLISFIALGLGALALVVAIIALFTDPLTRGLRAYDLDTPRDALISEAKMQEKVDAKALMELDLLRNGRNPAEFAKTLEVEKEQTFEGKKLLFVKWTHDGVEKHAVRAVEKDAESGFWIPTQAPQDAELDRGDRALAQSVRQWENGGMVR